MGTGSTKPERLEMGTSMTTAIATYHPAYIKKDEARAAPTFIADIKKAVSILHGQQRDPIPPIEINPTMSRVEQYFKEWENKWAFDLETTRTKPHKLLSMAFAGEGSAFVLDLSIRRNWQNVIRKAFLEAAVIVVQNGAFDLPLMLEHGIGPHGNWRPVFVQPVFDTMLAGHILNPDDYVNLSHLCSLSLDVPAWKHLSGEDLLNYNALDAIHTWSLYHAQVQELTLRNQYSFFIGNVMPLLRYLVVPLNGRGIKLDIRKRKGLLGSWDALAGTWREDLAAHFERLSVSFKRDLQPPLGKQGGLSNKQLQHLLYEVLGLPVQHNPTTRQPCVDKHVLAKLEPLDTTGTIELLLRRSRLKENEVHLKVEADPDGRVRARWVLGGDEKHRELTEKGASRAKDRGPATGRAASREPNHQNVPPSAKEIYVPTYPDWWFVEGDSSQIEARLTAWFSGDNNLWKAIEHDDIYLYTMCLIDQLTGLYGVHKEGWEALQARKAAGDPELLAYRQESKRSFLGWSYRMGAKKLEGHTGIPFRRAKDIIEALNHSFPAVVEIWNHYEAKAQSDGYLENPFGRRRYFPIFDVPKVCNFMSQSTAADILFNGHRRLGVGLDASIGRPCDCGTCKNFRPRAESAVNDLLDHEPLGYFVATVHDSNLLEGPKWEPLAALLKQVMEYPIEVMQDLIIPCDIKIGKDWKNMKEVQL